MDGQFGLTPYTPEQERMLAFLAAYYEISVDELERRIVAVALDDLEDALGIYADARLPPQQPKPGRVLDFPREGG